MTCLQPARTGSESLHDMTFFFFSPFHSANPGHGSPTTRTTR
jgi:hypothetical protein